MLLVENRLPDSAAVGRLPHAASWSPHIVDCWIAGHTSDRGHPSCAIGSDQPPAHSRIETGINRGRKRGHRLRLGGDQREADGHRYESEEGCQFGELDIRINGWCEAIEKA